MATYLGTSSVFQANSAASAGNLGGGFFNPNNTHFSTDGVIAGGTGNAATVSPTSSYTFVSGDVGAMVFFPIQTGVTVQSWFPIVSVAAGVATLNTSVGAGLQLVNNRFVPNATAGCSSTATPTLTYGVDYSRLTLARYTASTATVAITGTTFTDTTNIPGKNWLGNGICLSNVPGGTPGWYEAVSITGTTITLDRSPGNNVGSTTYYTGGAVSLGGSTTGITDLIFFQLGSNATTTGCRFFVKKGNYTTTANITTSLSGNSAWPSIIEGYNSINGDRPSIQSGNQPVLSLGTFSFTLGDYSLMYCLTFNTTSNSGVVIGNSNGQSSAINCKVINSSITANRTGFGIAGTSISSSIIGCEAVSYNGYAMSISTSTTVFACYIHDSNYGILTGGSACTIVDNIIVSCKSQNIGGQSPGTIVCNNTIYGGENKTGIGLGQIFPGSITLNNVIYGFTSGIGGSNTEFSGILDYNCYFNNTANINAASSGAFFGVNDLTAINPTFTSVSQVTGTTATTSATTLTDGGKNFTTAGVVAGRDYLNVTASTGGTVAIYGITAVGTTTLTTDNALGTGTGVNYQITTGRNFAIGTGLKGAGYPGSFPAGLTTGYLDIGAVQRQETASGGGAFTFGF